jgi:hypothetical protein
MGWEMQRANSFSLEEWIVLASGLSNYRDAINELQQDLRNHDGMGYRYRIKYVRKDRGEL